MARVTYGALVTDLRGSIGGITFQNNSSGPIARLKPKTVVNSSAQQRYRQVGLVNLVSLWGTLTQGQKDDWSDLATAHSHFTPWGTERTLSGYQWFLSYNLNRLTMDLAPSLIPAAFVTVDPPSAFTIEADVDDIEIVWASEESFPGTYMSIFCSGVLKQFSPVNRKVNYLIHVWTTEVKTRLSVKDYFEDYFNVTWADFYPTIKGTIIIRLLNYSVVTGYSSIYTAATIRI